MKPRKIAGVVLIVLGGLVLAVRQLTYTTSETVAELGPLEVREQDERTIPLPPIAGGIALAVGAGLLLMPAKR